MMPDAWRQPAVRKTPGKFSFRYGGDAPLVIDLYGPGLQPEQYSEQMVLQPQTWSETRYTYRSLTCLQAGAIPTARVEVKSRAHRRPYTVMPLQWSNLWVYGQEIILAGYLPFEEVWNISRPISQGRLRPAPTLEVPLANLYSLPQFLEQVSLRR
jgi:hypothetical protein